MRGRLNTNHVSVKADVPVRLNQTTTNIPTTELSPGSLFAISCDSIKLAASPDPVRLGCPLISLMIGYPDKHNQEPAGGIGSKPLN